MVAEWKAVLSPPHWGSESSCFLPQEACAAVLEKHPSALTGRVCPWPRGGGGGWGGSRAGSHVSLVLTGAPGG